MDCSSQALPGRNDNCSQKNNVGLSPEDRKEVEKHLALLAVFNPKYREAAQEIVPQETLDVLIREIEEKGILASFDGASDYLGLS